MSVTQEDIEAFHSKADNVAEEVDVMEMGRIEKTRSVRVAFSKGSIDSLAVLEVRPRHRFVVKGPYGSRLSTTREDEAVERIRELV